MQQQKWWSFYYLSIPFIGLQAIDLQIECEVNWCAIYGTHFYNHPKWHFVPKNSLSQKLKVIQSITLHTIDSVLHIFIFFLFVHQFFSSRNCSNFFCRNEKRKWKEKSIRMNKEQNKLNKLICIVHKYLLCNGFVSSNAQIFVTSMCVCSNKLLCVCGGNKSQCSNKIF